MSKIPRNSFYYMLGKLVQVFFSIFVVSYIARYFGPDDYGIIGLGNSILMIGLIISETGFSGSAVFFAARHMKNAARLKGVYNFFLKWRLVFAAVVSVLLFAFTKSIAGFYNEPRLASVLPIFALMLFLQSIASLSQNFFSGAKRMGFYSVTDIVFNVSKIFVFVFVFAGFGLVGAVSGYAFASALMAGVGIYVVFKHFYPKGRAKKIEGEMAKNIVVYSFPIWALNIADRLNFHFQNLFLATLSIVDVSYYTLSMTCQALFIMFGQSIEASLFPEVSEDGDEKRVARKLALSVKYWVVYALYAAPLAIMLSNRIIGLVFGRDFSGAALTFTFVVVAGVFNGMAYVFRSVLFGKKKPWDVFSFTAASLGINLTMCFFLINKFKSVGAGAALLVSMFFMMLLFFLKLRRLVSFSFPTKDLFKALFACVVMTPVTFVFSEYLHLGLFEIPINLFVSFVVYFGILWKVGVVGEDEVMLVKRVIRF